MNCSDSPESTDQWGAAAEHWARAAEKDEIGASADAAKRMLKAVLDPLPEAKLNAIRDDVLSIGREFVTPAGSAVFPATILGARAQKSA